VKDGEMQGEIIFKSSDGARSQITDMTAISFMG
jgi:hypothetical protein